MSDRPTCGTCPHRIDVGGAPRCLAFGPRGHVALAADAGCIHHSDMPDWVAQQRQPVRQPPSRADWRSNSRPEYPSQAEAVRAFIGAPTWQQAREKRERDAQSGQPQAATSDQLAELEQWRGAFVWRGPFVGMEYSLRTLKTGTELSDVRGSIAGYWTVGGGGQRYDTSQDAMRAAEQALGLPRCRVEGKR